VVTTGTTVFWNVTPSDEHLSVVAWSKKFPLKRQRISIRLSSFTSLNTMLLFFVCFSDVSKWCERLKRRKSIKVKV